MLEGPTQHRVSFGELKNWIGIPGCTLNTAKYVPPTPEDLPDCLNAFETFLHDRSLSPLIHITLCHYQFESIHPFLDGNGRVGRLFFYNAIYRKKTFTLTNLIRVCLF